MSFDAIIDDTTFQTQFMINKIQKVMTQKENESKIKKKKKIENYKNINIELFENIHEISEKMEIPEKIIEGLSQDGKAHPEDDDWEGTDGIENKIKKIKDPRHYLIEFINKLYEWVIFGITWISLNITKTLSGNSFNENDVEIVKKYICWTLSIFVVCFFLAKNWFFIMFYKNDSEKRPELLGISREKYEELAENNYGLAFLKPFIIYAFYFPELFEKYIINFLPDILSKYIGPTVLFSALYFLLVYITNNFTTKFKDLFIDIINVNYKNPVVSIMYMIITVLFIYDYLIKFDLRVKPMFEMYMRFINPINMIFHLIYVFMLYGVVVYLSPLLGGFFIIFYILYYSFIRPFMNDDEGGNVSYDSEKVSKYAADSNKYLINETSCKPLYWYEKSLQFILKFCMYMHRHIDIVAFVIMLIASLIEYSVKIKSNNLKVILIICNIVLIICCIIVSYILEKNATPIVGGNDTKSNDVKPSHVKKGISSIASMTSVASAIGNDINPNKVDSLPSISSDAAKINNMKNMNPNIQTNIHKESNDLIMNSLSILKSAAVHSDKIMDENEEQNKDKETMSNIIGMSNSLMKSQNILTDK
jgi:hypothetical protein